jgi:molybdenum cofactor biosynthesis enzyme MoaA
MYCARLDHFVKIAPPIVNLYENSIARCCNMIHEPRFASLEELEHSEWLLLTKRKMSNNEWPPECIRCKQSEELGNQSMRNHSNDLHLRHVGSNPKYLVVDVVVDILCNAACQMCEPELSTFYAKLYNVKVDDFDGLRLLQTIDDTRIVQLDILGGEPSISRRVKLLLEKISNLQSFTTVRTIRVNSNGSSILPDIVKILDRGIEVVVTLSLDGTRKEFEYVRYPISWDKFTSTVNFYRELKYKYSNLTLNFWSVYTALSIGSLGDMIQFSKKVDIPFSGSALVVPKILAVSRTNYLTVHAKQRLVSLAEFDSRIQSIVKDIATDDEDSSDELNAFIEKSDKMRSISFDEHYAGLGINRKGE